MGVVEVIIVAVLVALAALLFYLAYRSKVDGWQQRVRVTPPPVRVRPSPRAPIRSDVPHLLYKYVWLSSGDDAYFGISNEPEKRHARHGVDPKDQWWYALTTKQMIEVTWYPDRVTAKAAEMTTIAREAHAGKWLANTHHNPYARYRRGRTRA